MRAVSSGSWTTDACRALCTVIEHTFLSFSASATHISMMRCNSATPYVSTVLRSQYRSHHCIITPTRDPKWLIRIQLLITTTVLQERPQDPRHQARLEGTRESHARRYVPLLIASAPFLILPSLSFPSIIVPPSIPNQTLHSTNSILQSTPHSEAC